MNATLKGAARSKTIWINVALAALGGLELMGSHVTALWGPKVAAAVVMAGALVNIALRAYTAQSLAEKGGA